MKKLISILLTVCLTVIMIIPQTACTANRDPVTKESFYFDTTCKISIYDMKDMDEEKAKDVISDAFQKCADYEALLSKTKEGSDIYRINHAGGKPVKCDPLTVKIIKKGIHYGDLSGGRFDITIGKAEDLWDFHSDKHHVPSEKSLKEAVRYVNYKQIHIHGNTVQMGTSKGEIDLGGIGKGYVGDLIAKYLKKRGVTSAIISLGGNIICVGDKDGEDFVIGIEKPFSDMQEVVGSTPCSNGTVVTSGIYERYFKKNGKLYHHILDPKTGYPIDNDVSGVTITASAGHSGDSDCLSTICLILGTKKAKKFIEKQKGYEALFITRSGKITKTKGMEFDKN